MWKRIMTKKEIEEFKKDMKAAMDAARLITLQKILMMERNPKKIDIIGKEIDKVINEIKEKEKNNGS